MRKWLIILELRQFLFKSDYETITKIIDKGLIEICINEKTGQLSLKFVYHDIVNPKVSCMSLWSK